LKINLIFNRIKRKDKGHYGENEKASEGSSKSEIGHDVKVKKDKKLMKLEATQMRKMKTYIEKMIKGEIFCIEWLHGCEQ
jgi:hypothetical protein